MRRIISIAVSLFISLCLYAQTQNEISLVVSGQGSTKEDATANALRSAIEQAYGVFVSANTQILNDEVVKDEIATVASGNVLNYEELSCVTMADGSLYVTLSATVSIGNLITYAKSHGSSAEFAGQTFTMNMRMRKLNTENEYKALQVLKEQVAMLAMHCFDYKIEKIDEPKVARLGESRITSGHEIMNHLALVSSSEYVSAKSDFFWASNGYGLYVDIDKLEQMGARYSIDERILYCEHEGTVHEYDRDFIKYTNGDIFCEIPSLEKLKLPDLYLVRLKFKAVPNDNYKKIDSIINKTLGILSLSQEEQEALARNGMYTYPAHWNFDYKQKHREPRYAQGRFSVQEYDYVTGEDRYVFRNSHSDDVLKAIMTIFNLAAHSWILDVKGLDYYRPNIRQFIGQDHIQTHQYVGSILLCGRHKHDIKEIYFPPFLDADCYCYSSYEYEEINDLSQTVEFYLFEPSLYSVQGFDIKFSPELYEQGLRIINERSKE